MKNDKEYGEREQRIIQYIKDELTQKDIGKLEGLRADYAGWLRRKIANKHGLQIKYGHSQVKLDKKSPSWGMRWRLGSKLNELMILKKLKPIEVTMKTGVPRKLLTKAIESPNNYDWKISELEKLAKETGTPFREFIMKLVENE